jgi:hypothetical protein
MPVILDTQEVGSGGLWLEGKKLVRPHLNNKLGMVVHTSHPSYTGGIGRRITGKKK